MQLALWKDAQVEERLEGELGKLSLDCSERALAELS